MKKFSFILYIAIAGILLISTSHIAIDSSYIQNPDTNEYYIKAEVNGVLYHPPQLHCGLNTTQNSIFLTALPKQEFGNPDAPKFPQYHAIIRAFDKSSTYTYPVNFFEDTMAVQMYYYTDRMKSYRLDKGKFELIENNLEDSTIEASFEGVFYEFGNPFDPDSFVVTNGSIKVKYK